MMKKYKVVGVYSGYGEMYIKGVDVEEGKSLKDVCIKLLEGKKEFWKDDMSYFEEFVNCWGVEGNIGSLLEVKKVMGKIEIGL